MTSIGDLQGKELEDFFSAQRKLEFSNGAVEGRVYLKSSRYRGFTIAETLKWIEEQIEDTKWAPDFGQGARIVRLGFHEYYKSFKRGFQEVLSII